MGWNKQQERFGGNWAQHWRIWGLYKCLLTCVCISAGL